MVWCVKDLCGYVAVFFTYATLLVVDFSFVRVGIWYELRTHPVWAYTHCFLFQALIALISTCHLKCMFTNPGTLPRNYQYLNIQRLPENLTEMLLKLDVRTSEESVDLEKIEDQK